MAKMAAVGEFAEPFLWQGLVPLDQAVFNPDMRKADPINNECEGMCGV